VLRAVVLTLPACDGRTDGRTDRQTDGRKDGIAIANTALAMRALRAVKIVKLLAANYFLKLMMTIPVLLNYQKIVKLLVVYRFCFKLLTETLFVCAYSATDYATTCLVLYVRLSGIGL